MDGDKALTPDLRQLVYINRLALTEAVTRAASHRLATPLMYLSGSLRLLQNNTEARLAEPLLADALEGVQQIEQIARDLRQWLHTGPEEPRTVAWEEALQSALALARPLLHGRAALSVSPLPALALSIDPDAMLQILLNLILNAACAAELSSGERGVVLRLEPEPGAASLFVSDTGPGAASPERIFEPFYSGWPHMSAGLGLSVSRALAEASGGTLTLENPGQPGATFRLRLPAAGGATR